MKDSPSPTGNIVTSLIFFGVTAAIAIILFIDEIGRASCRE